ncbi:MAG: hypothetical protein OHK0039_14820 [Bacteroidia bacterium]
MLAYKIFCHGWKAIELRSKDQVFPARVLSRPLTWGRIIPLQDILALGIMGLGGCWLLALALLLSMPVADHTYEDYMSYVAPPALAQPQMYMTGENREPFPLNLAMLERHMGAQHIARALAMSGHVRLRVYIDEQGHYHAHEVLYSDHPVMTVAAETYLPELLCAPGLRGGIPAGMWTALDLVFDAGPALTQR